MPHCFLDGDQICTGFVKMQSEGMTQRVQVEAISRQAACLQLMDKDVVDRLLTDMGISFLSGEEPVFGFRTSVSSSDIGDEQIISFIGQDGVPVGAVLAAGDIDTVFGMVDIAAVQAAEFADTDPGRIQECDLSFVLRIEMESMTACTCSLVGTAGRDWSKCRKGTSRLSQSLLRT